LTVQSVNTTGTQGSVVINNDQTITYSPNGRFNHLKAGEEALDTFRYTVNDGAGATATATVTVHVGGINDSPVALNDGYTLAQRSSLTTTDVDGTQTPTILNDNGVLANDSDADRDVLTATLLVSPLHAANFVLNANGTFTYTHNGNTATSDSFTYLMDDGNGGAASATVTLTITPRPPSPWQNRANNLDVNNDGFVTPQDALININDLNVNGARQLPPPTQNNSPPPFYDVNGDGMTSPQDVLIIINFLNNRAAGGGEGEGGMAAWADVEGESSASADSSSVLALPDFTTDRSSAYGRSLLQHVLTREPHRFGAVESRTSAARVIDPQTLLDSLFALDLDEDDLADDEACDLEFDERLDSDANDSALDELFDEDFLTS
jgi:VCBS repeat-containing protein